MVKIKDVYLLRYEILKKGYTFTAFAAELSINKSHLNKIFRRGTIAPSLAKKVTETLGFEFDYFFYVDSVQKYTV